MPDLLLAVVRSCWGIFAESAPYVLFGFFAAGLLKGLIPEEAVSRHLGSNSLGSVLKASLFGIPLPLCSCGVIPAAVGLRKQGASKGAAAAFLVSVPETGVDSVAITWALLDPLMTLLRPLAAFVTATVTGVLINFLPDHPPPPPETPPPGCGCQENQDADAPAPPGRGARLRAGLGYAFGDLLQDIGRWLLLGILIAGVLAALVPADFFARHLKGELLSLLLMLGIGVPLYICASASTPIAAALVLKGLSPGAALVFLLAGPATNAATVTVVRRYWGRAPTLVYLASIGACSLLLGWCTNRLYAWSGLDITGWVSVPAAGGRRWWELGSALLLAALLLRPWWPWRPVTRPPGGT